MGAAAGEDIVLAPYATTTNEQVIVGGVFTAKAVAERAAREMLVPRAKQKRFVAECRVRLLERRPSVLVRFGRNAAWGHFDQVWIGVAESCAVKE